MTQALSARLKKADSDAEGYTGASKGTLVICNGPRVARKRFQDACELQLALLNGQQEPRSAESLLWHRLTWSRCSTILL
jgi:hypothetical protein